jgi:xylulokinase
VSYLLGIDIGSSSVKAALVEIATSRAVGQASSPATELEILAPEPGWAEQDPAMWWVHTKLAVEKLLKASGVSGQDISAIGIAYQMHGLVLVDKNHRVLRPAIIWCDSRAVTVGQQALNEIGNDYCLAHYLNAPGNFTASKLAWVKQFQPDIYKQVHKAMLPGDYVALQLTGEITTTVSGLSEGIFWDFSSRGLAHRLLQQYGIDPALLPATVPTFSVQGTLSKAAAAELGLKAGIPISYRAGDQPNNAFSLNVLNPGEVAATAGTSAVIYAVTDQNSFDRQSRVNTFVHVNDAKGAARNGVLLCINGAGILNSWLRQQMAGMGYPEMNALAETVAIGADGLSIFPFGNGAERILLNRNLGAHVANLDLNRHHRGHLARAAQEGIVFALAFGFEALQSMAIRPAVIRAGHANMFLSPVFREAFVNTLQIPLERYHTDGASGAARGAGIGAGIFTEKSAFLGLEKIGVDEPDAARVARYQECYAHWRLQLQSLLAAG